MIKRVLLLAIVCMLSFGVVSCADGLGNGNLIGTVVRAGNGEPITSPWLIVGKVLKSPLIPDQIIRADTEGRFEIYAKGGAYTIQISTNENGPFYTWPDPVTIEEGKTTVALFELPEGY